MENLEIYVNSYLVLNLMQIYHLFWNVQNNMVKKQKNNNFFSTIFKQIYRCRLCLL